MGKYDPLLLPIKPLNLSSPKFAQVIMLGLPTIKQNYKKICQ